MWLLLLLIALGHIPKLQAQSSIKDVPSKNWEFATDLLPLIGKQTDPGVGLMLKRHYLKDTKARAWRFKFNPSFIGAATSIVQSGASIGIGYEWRKVDSKFIWLYGSDYIVSIFNSSQPSTTITYLYLNPFIGAQYRIDRHWAVSLESHLSIRAAWISGDNRPTDFGFSGRLIPIQAINFSYFLK